MQLKAASKRLPLRSTDLKEEYKPCDNVGYRPVEDELGCITDMCIEEQDLPPATVTYLAAPDRQPLGGGRASRRGPTHQKGRHARQLSKKDERGWIEER